MSAATQPLYLRMTLTSIDNPEEVLFSNEATSAEPIEIMPGEGHIFPKVEEQAVNMNVGDRQKVSLKHEEAFGPVNPEAIQKVPVDSIPEDLRKEGSLVAAQVDENQTIHGTVTSLESDIAIIDFNHPLAGKDMNVEFVIVEKPAE